MCAYVFLSTFLEFMCILPFPSSIFFNAMIQNVHKNRWMETQLMIIHLLGRERDEF